MDVWNKPVRNLVIAFQEAPLDPHLHHPEFRLTIYFSCIGYKFESDSVDTRRYTAGAGDDTLRTGAAREHISSLRVHSCAARGASAPPAPLGPASRRHPPAPVPGRPVCLLARTGDVRATGHKRRSSTGRCTHSRTGCRTDICQIDGQFQVPKQNRVSEEKIYVMWLQPISSSTTRRQALHRCQPCSFARSTRACNPVSWGHSPGCAADLQIKQVRVPHSVQVPASPLCSSI